MPSKVLLTGASGFIGSRLAQLLVASGADVTSVGRHECPVPGVRNVLVPILTAASIDAGLPGGNIFDGLFHLAAAGVKPGDRNSESIFSINTSLAPALVAFAARRGIGTVVMAGTSAEYGSSSVAEPLREDAPLETRKLYGASKAAGGILSLANGAHEKVQVGVLRLFNVFGPGEGSHRLLPSLTRSLRSGEPVDLSVGTQVRDFVYIDDVCHGLMAAMSALTLGQMASDAYNLATGRGNTVADFARAVAQSMHADPSLLRFGALPLRPDDLPYVVGHPGKLRSACGWYAETSLTDGIARAVAQLRRSN